MCVLVDETNELAELGDMLQRLRETGTSFRIFGWSSIATHSARRFQMAAFESANRIRLPNDY
jgi:hypothetical protein